MLGGVGGSRPGTGRCSRRSLRAFLPAGEDRISGGPTVWGTTAADPEGPSEISSSNQPTYRGGRPSLRGENLRKAMSHLV